MRNKVHEEIYDQSSPSEYLLRVSLFNTFLSQSKFLFIARQTPPPSLPTHAKAKRHDTEIRQRPCKKYNAWSAKFHQV